MSNFDRNTSFGYRGGVSRAGTAEIDQGLRAYMLGVYNYMVLGLGVTGFVALGTHMLAVAKEGGRQIALTPFGQMLYTSPLKWVVMLAPLAFVFFLGFRADRISAATARNLFLAFSAVMGLSMSSIMIVFTGASIAKVFFITAAAFGGLSLYGYMTKRDLSAFGSFLVMGLWGLVLASLVNLFFQSSALQFGLSILSVFIFAGLTAWDTQSIKDGYYQSAGYGHEVVAKQSIFGALSLYLDFINMFQSLLYLFGDRND
ncbi:Bax inhibitor-1/YccA family protein [Methylosinus sp. H3A]|uniref:Bax inhibitor-1/YccA family protein n=1 Tax=Methylosinus sp. H3A TaxID=2785786 RepID=UPI0018C2E349|nr:Bax inhibitor-1/YccA family protein [Methylosinus sp. H3A]MBG0812271.1 Bax inhibitor-1/YccA family protein [Methylosinus sp. H3A]